MAAESKQEFENEKFELTTKYAELKQRLEEKEDELNHKNINFEKEHALMKQQIHFSDKKVEEMQV